MWTNANPMKIFRLGFVSIIEGGYPLLDTKPQNQVLFPRREFDFQLT